MSGDDANDWAIELAAVSLARGGQIAPPPDSELRAAVNWIIAQDLSRVLIEAIRDGTASLKVEGDDLLWVGPDDVIMVVKRLSPKRSKRSSWPT